MKCESCNINQIEVEELYDEGQKPYCLCKLCQSRLINKALRPLELFNLVAIHGHGYYLHDDFYDYQTGLATQPDIEVLEANKFPFPEFDTIKKNLEKLIDFAFVQYFTDDFVIEQLKTFDKERVLEQIGRKVKCNRVINYKAYEIVAKAVGLTAEKWIKNEWENRKENELLIFAEAIAKCLNFNEAFDLLTKEIEKEDEKYLSDNISALLYFQNERTLDWIEKISNRIKNISSNWGTLTAASNFTWERAEKWLTIGRPLSLISLDALVFCTSKGDRQNQAFWLQKHPPKLIDNERPEIIATKLKEYLKIDSVSRTKKAVNKIINNIFE
jgi:hypothetical protein